MVQQVVGKFLNTNRRRKLGRALAAKLLEIQTAMYQSALHHLAPPVAKEESASDSMPCNAAGFCLYGADGINIKVMHDALNRTLFATRFHKHNKHGITLLSEWGRCCVSAC